MLLIEVGREVEKVGPVGGWWWGGWPGGRVVPGFGFGVREGAEEGLGDGWEL